MKPRILTLASSLSANSRSTTLAKYAYSVTQESSAVDSDFIDISHLNIQIYPRSEKDPLLQSMIDRFEGADGFILASPIYNWSAGTNLLNFFHYALDPENGRRYRPFLLLAGAGGYRSHLAMDGIARTLLMEMHGIQVGPPIVGCHPDLDPEQNIFSVPLQTRIRLAVTVLERHAVLQDIVDAGDAARE